MISFPMTLSAMGEFFLWGKSPKLSLKFIYKTVDTIHKIVDNWRCRDEIKPMATSNATLKNVVFVVEKLPDGDFDWLLIWEGECKILCSEEDSETGFYDFYETGISSIFLKRETEDGQTTLSISIPNNAELDETLEAAVAEKFCIDMRGGNWGSDGEGGQYCSFTI